MELSVKKEILVDGIQLVQNAIAQKSSLPILSNVLLETESNKLSLTATDLDIGISASIPVETSEAGSITIPAKKFFDVIRSLPDESTINLILNKNNFLAVKSGKVQFKIIGLPKDEFPQLPLFKDKDSIVIEQRDLREMLNLTDFAVSRDDTRYVLNGVLLVIKEDKLSIVATDGRRLALINKKLEKRTLVDRTAIIPSKTVQEVKRMLKDEGQIKVKFSDTQIQFDLPGSFVLSRLIEGEFPNYNKVVPEKVGKVVKIGREEFLAATRRASIFTDQESVAVKINVKKKKMTISKNTPYLGEAREEINVEYNGDDEIEIGFNPKYLIDVLRNLEEEELLFEINGANKPGVVRRGDEYVYVVLPMQIAV